MTGARRSWLVTNEASGSNAAEATEDVKRVCSRAGLALDRIVHFPSQPMPTPAALDRAGVDTVAVFAGDGTVNALVAALAGWGGAVLVLPGGTMNLLFHRLHGDRETEEVVRLAGAGATRRIRPGVIACDAGTALADCLSGPGTRWYEVREAMREADVLAVAGSAAAAVSETLVKPGIVCRQPDLGRADGYPLVMLTPTDEGIRIAGFYADTAAEFLQGSWALLRRRFREGPRDDLGLVGQVILASTDGEPIGTLLDGEQARSPAEAAFRLVPCPVDLLATGGDGR
jgi:hypothetical protein